MKKVRMITIIIINLLLFGFKLNDSVINNNDVKSRVYRLSSVKLDRYNLRSAIWTPNFLIATFAANYIKINADFEVYFDSIIGDVNLLTTYPFTMSLNRLRNKIIYVVSP